MNSSVGGRRVELVGGGGQAGVEVLQDGDGGEEPILLGLVLYPQVHQVLPAHLTKFPTQGIHRMQEHLYN